MWNRNTTQDRWRFDIWLPNLIAFHCRWRDLENGRCGDKQMSVTYLNPEGHPLPAGRYSHVAIAQGGRIAFIAGQVAVDADGVLQAPGDTAAQMAVVFRNLGNVLEKLGVGFGDVLELTTYLVGEDAREPWMAARGDVYAEHYGDGPFPPNTLLIISGLAHPDMKVEISATVRLPG